MRVQILPIRKCVWLMVYLILKFFPFLILRFFIKATKTMIVVAVLVRLPQFGQQCQKKNYRTLWASHRLIARLLCIQFNKKNAMFVQKMILYGVFFFTEEPTLIFIFQRNSSPSDIISFQCRSVILKTTDLKTSVRWKHL